MNTSTTRPLVEAVGVTPHSACRDRLEAYLREHRVWYEVEHHGQAFTAQQVAAEDHVSGKRFAKVVMVLAGGRPSMLVLPASRTVDLARAAQLLGDPQIRLAKEDEFVAAFPDCEVGAMPPFGHLYGLPVLVDRSLMIQDVIHFQAGSHVETMAMRYADYARIARPLVGDFAYRSHE